MKRESAPYWKSKFYNSKDWKKMRQMIIQRDKGICFFCGKLILESPEVDHEIELTKDNWFLPEISLNPELLRLAHKKCHNRRHKRFGTYEKDTIVNDELEIDYERR